MKQVGNQNRGLRLEGYLLIPHELLHVAGFRLVGKRCEYKWGNRHVTPIGPMTRERRLVGILFPFVITGIYAGAAIGDLRKAYLLIVDKPWYSWTPFDIFFWPVVDWWAIRKRVAARQIDDKCV